MTLSGVVTIDTDSGDISDTVNADGSPHADTVGGWRTVSFDLSGFIGQTISIAFDFDSVDDVITSYSIHYTKLYDSERFARDFRSAQDVSDQRLDVGEVALIGMSADRLTSIPSPIKALPLSCDSV